MTSAEVSVRRKSALDEERGLAPIRAAVALALAGDDTNWRAAATLAERRWPDDPAVPLYIERAAVAPLGSSDVPTQGAAGTAAFLASIRSREIFSQLPGLRRVPLSERLSVQTAGASASWVAEGSPTPVTTIALSSSSLPPRKVSAILVATKAVAEFEDPAAEMLIRDDLVAAAAEATGSKFLSADAATSAAPAGIANGVTPTAGTGDIAADVVTLVDGFSRADELAICMPVAAAVQLALAAPAAASGELAGIRILPTDSANGRLVAFDQARVAFGDGGVAIDSAQSATVQLESAPDDPADAATVLTSLWQHNLIGLRARRWVNWKVAAAADVAVITGY